MYKNTYFGIQPAHLGGGKMPSQVSYYPSLVEFILLLHVIVG